MNRHFYLFLFTAMAFSFHVNGQSISQSSINSMGSSYSVSGIQLSSSAGQPAYSTLQNGNIILTQGFQQPYFLHLLNLKAFLEGYYTGSGQMYPALYSYNPSYPAGTSDSLTVELHESASPYAAIASGYAFLQSNGTASIAFSQGISGYYYIVLKHRNSLEVWSKDPQLFSGESLLFDISQ